MAGVRDYSFLFLLAALTASGSPMAEIVLEKPAMPDMPSAPTQLPVVYLAWPSITSIVLQDTLIPFTTPQIHSPELNAAERNRQSLSRSRTWSVVDPDQVDTGRWLVYPRQPQRHAQPTAPIPGSGSYNTQRAARNVDRAHALRLELNQPQTRK